MIVTDDWKPRSYVKVKGQCKNMCAAQFIAASCENWLMAVVVGFHCNVVSCELAWRGVQRGAAETTAAAAESSAYGRGNVVGLTLILD